MKLSFHVFLIYVKYLIKVEFDDNSTNFGKNWPHILSILRNKYKKIFFIINTNILKMTYILI